MNKLMGFVKGFFRGVLIGGGIIVLLIGSLQLLVAIVQAYDYPMYFDPYLETLIDIYNAEQPPLDTEYYYSTFEEKCANAVGDYKYMTDPLIPDFFKRRAEIDAAFYLDRLKRCGFALNVRGEWVRRGST